MIPHVEANIRIFVEVLRPRACETDARARGDACSEGRVEFEHGVWLVLCARKVVEAFVAYTASLVKIYSLYDIPLLQVISLGSGALPLAPAYLSLLSLNSTLSLIPMYLSHWCDLAVRKEAPRSGGLA